MNFGREETCRCCSVCKIDINAILSEISLDFRNETSFNKSHGLVELLKLNERGSLHYLVRKEIIRSIILAWHLSLILYRHQRIKWKNIFLHLMKALPGLIRYHWWAMLWKLIIFPKSKMKFFPLAAYNSLGTSLTVSWNLLITQVAICLINLSNSICFPDEIMRNEGNVSV